MKIAFDVSRVEVVIINSSATISIYSKYLPNQYPEDLRSAILKIESHVLQYAEILAYLGITEFKLIDTRC